MKVRFRQSFTKDLRALKDQSMLDRVRKLRGKANHYRIRVGDYRCGLTLDDDIVTFVRFLHRREIYRLFP